MLCKFPMAPSTARRRRRRCLYTLPRAHHTTLHHLPVRRLTARCTPNCCFQLLPVASAGKVSTGLYRHWASSGVGLPRPAASSASSQICQDNFFALPVQAHMHTQLGSSPGTLVCRSARRPPIALRCRHDISPFGALQRRRLAGAEPRAARYRGATSHASPPIRNVYSIALNVSGANCSSGGGGVRYSTALHTPIRLVAHRRPEDPDVPSSYPLVAPMAYTLGCIDEPLSAVSTSQRPPISSH